MQNIEQITNKNVKRIVVDCNLGLSAKQVKERFDAGLNNIESGIKLLTEKEIILKNIFTFFNLLNFTFAFLIISVGLIRNVAIIDIVKNLLFMGVILSNTVIGSFQEIRSKRIIEKLSLISAPKATVLREGVKVKIPTTEVVLDDIMCMSAGGQVCADALVVKGEVEVNESLITGEANAVLKSAGQMLLSGSFIISGECLARAEKVGEDNYANKIVKEAKYIKKHSSQIKKSLDTIVKTIGISIIPVGLILFFKQYYILGDSLEDTMFTTIAALIGMIPEGLVLLTSLVFAVSVIRLAMHKTLVQELYSVETLARVDVLCLDKTGTITEGSMLVDEFLAFDGSSEKEMINALRAMGTELDDDNATINAIRDRVEGSSDWESVEKVPFSSARKWSGAAFKGKGSFVLGAGEFVLKDKFTAFRKIAEKYSKNGQRVLLLAKSPNKFNTKDLPSGLIPMGFVILSDKIRDEAGDTIKYFEEQGVDIKVISGDNPITVSHISRKVGIRNADKYIDATLLKCDNDIADAVNRYSVFGRVTPEQKIKIIKALKAQDHVVAMTGDGVNDVLALKEADCSIAMASGSDAARSVSNLVLMDSNFSSMPLVVREGRRSINNLQRSAALFLSKTTYSVLLSITFMIVAASYPFEPVHLTLISTLTIGIPSFILALGPNKQLVKGSFLVNVLKKAIPTGVSIFLNVVALLIIDYYLGYTPEQLSTLAVIVTASSAFILLFRISCPLNLIRTILFASMVAAFVGALFILPFIFNFTPLDSVMIIIVAALTTLSLFVSSILTNIIEQKSIKNNKK